MNRVAHMALLGAIALSLAATAAWAGPPFSIPHDDAAALENSRARVAWEARNAKGIDKQQLRNEEQRLQGIIDELQRGGHVDPGEIDRTLNRTY